MYFPLSEYNDDFGEGWRRDGEKNALGVTPEGCDWDLYRSKGGAARQVELLGVSLGNNVSSIVS